MTDQQLIKTFDSVLDQVLGGGIPVPSLNVIAGQPGAGKTIFSQQLLFHYVKQNPGEKALYLSTMSEPPAKLVRYMRAFEFFSPELIGESSHVEDIGEVVRSESLDAISQTIIEKVRSFKPALVVIDSFKAIHDTVDPEENFRQFVYRLAVRLYQQQCLTFLVGEYLSDEIFEGAEFAVADGIFTLEITENLGETQRLFQVRKLRGRNPLLRAVPFGISGDGVRLFHPRHMNGESGVEDSIPEKRLPTGIPGLDHLLTGGVLPGRSVILSGVSGTGKTTTALQIATNASKSGRCTLYYSFEESRSCVESTASAFGWDLKTQEGSGTLRFVHIPQNTIRVDEHIDRIAGDIEEFRPDWVILDSFSVFLHRLTAAAKIREKTEQLKRIIQRSGAVGLLLSDIPATNQYQLSRFGVEETVADGTIVLSSSIEDRDRRRFLEVYKMRQTPHISGKKRMIIGDHGIQILHPVPKTKSESDQLSALTFSPIASLVDADVRYGSAWLVRGEAGIGKSILAVQFALEGLLNNESVVFVTADSPGNVVVDNLRTLGEGSFAEEDESRLHIIDGYSKEHMDITLRDKDHLLYVLMNRVEELPSPVRVIFDSITPLHATFEDAEFFDLIQEKNRLFHQPDVAVLDLLLYEFGESTPVPEMLNMYDVVLDMYYSRRRHNRNGHETPAERQLQIYKYRGAFVAPEPVTFQLTIEKGIEVQHSI